MKTTAALTFALLVAAGPALAHDTAAGDAPAPRVTPVTQKDLPDYPGKEITVITVDYPPGLVEHAHRHDAHAIVYVLEGEIIEGVKGQPEQHLKAGDSFYEGPTDIHTVGRNASATKPAKFLVFILKDKKNPIVMPAP